MNKYLLCTDLDRTLIPNGAQPGSPGALARFRRLVRRGEITLAYVTGRHRALVAQAMAEFDLPQPDFVIADVGTTIYRIGASGWRHWEEWDAHIAPDWHGWSPAELRRLLGVFTPLRPQEAEKQGRYKLSFYAAPDMDAPRLMAEMQALLQQAGIRANLVWSIDHAAATGLLDVLPARANKLHAIRFLMQRQGFHDASTVFAGDSGNDLDVLLSGLPAVLVANADAHVKRLAATRQDTCYAARGGYLGMNGNYSAGILEGVAHHWPEVDAWLRAQD